MGNRLLTAAVVMGSWWTALAGPAYLVKDIDPATAPPGPAVSAAAWYAPADSFVYFLAGTPNANRALWRSDGTPAGTQILIDPRPGSSDSAAFMSPATLGDLLIFNFDDGSTGDELWVSDGTTAGTHVLVDIVPGPDPSNPARFATMNGA